MRKAVAPMRAFKTANRVGSLLAATLLRKFQYHLPTRRSPTSVIRRDRILTHATSQSLYDIVLNNTSLIGLAQIEGRFFGHATPVNIRN